jgi:hypothetical protein
MCDAAEQIVTADGPAAWTTRERDRAALLVLAT